MDITKNIKTIRGQKGIKQIDMAARMNLERSNYSRIENKGNEISIRQLQEIADALEVPLFDLIFPQEAKALSKANSTIPKLIQSNEDLLDFKSKVETLFNFLTGFVPALEQMGFTEEKVRTQLDPDGRLETYTKEKLKELKESLDI
ncbi:helix-turn-helix domain-containing protein [Spirosoma sp. KCTC 42546]|uniref:helix-turn-helix domain-containing protein n=1 Tax=Spirosoma sp. KCTC 42546 TaxID=2520506 RepID=UPI00143E0D34|nr:helix-turn-helix transcriptional regulator [Spirosoma sp. KCTC 42546]